MGDCCFDCDEDPRVPRKSILQQTKTNKLRMSMWTENPDNPGGSLNLFIKPIDGVGVDIQP